MEELEKTSTPQFKRCYCCKEIKSECEFPISNWLRHNYKCTACRLDYWREYVKTPYGRERHNEAARNYAHSERGLFIKKKRQHEIQDEAGCHWKPETFYPAYRFIKALETAEVVEV